MWHYYYNKTVKQQHSETHSSSNSDAVVVVEVILVVCHWQMLFWLILVACNPANRSCCTNTQQHQDLQSKYKPPKTPWWHLYMQSLKNKDIHFHYATVQTHLQYRIHDRQTHMHTQMHTLTDPAYLKFRKSSETITGSEKDLNSSMLLQNIYEVNFQHGRHRKDYVTSILS